MRGLLGLLLLIANASCVCKDPTTLTPIEVWVLDLHNELRARHPGTPPLCYGESAENVTYNTEEWVGEMIEMGNLHHTKKVIGENLYAGGSFAKGFTEEKAYSKGLMKWYNEVDNYNFVTAKAEPAGVEVRHFTQMVWLRTEEVNCALQFFPDPFYEKRKKVMTVCQYYPKGNTQGGYGRNVMPLARPNTTVIPGQDSTDIKPESLGDSRDLGDTGSVSIADSGAAGGKEGFRDLAVDEDKEGGEVDYLYEPEDGNSAAATRVILIPFLTFPLFLLA